MPSWKQLFLTQARREHCMMGAQPQDFTYREATGGLGTGMGNTVHLLEEMHWFWGVCVCVFSFSEEKGNEDVIGLGCCDDKHWSQLPAVSPVTCAAWRSQSDLCTTSN